MQYTTLGKTGVKVSRLCFGTMSFGGDADEQTSAKMFDMCREAGINFFDCANMYSKGKAEEILGRLMKGCRDELVITTKVGFNVGDGRVEPGLSRRSIMMAVEDSLRRLQTDWIDVYFCHTFDNAVPVEETLTALTDLVSQGKILYIGVSNWAAWQIARAIGKTELLKLAPIHVVQPMYNLVKRTTEIEIFPLAQAEGLAVIPYSPLGAGLLTGKYSTTQKDLSGRIMNVVNYKLRYSDEMYYEIAERFCGSARQHKVHPATLAVAWVKAHPAVTAPIIGARNPEQLKASLDAADYEMSREQWEEISALSYTPPPATDRTEERHGVTFASPSSR